jgi:hypothetical protein
MEVQIEMDMVGGVEDIKGTTLIMTALRATTGVEGVAVVGMVVMEDIVRAAIMTAAGRKDRAKQCKM